MNPTPARGVVYVATSALGALLIDQPESQAVLEWLDHNSATLISSDLLETELRRLAIREGLTLDALHVEAASRLDASHVLTYDRRLGDAARAAGLEVLSPEV